MSGPVQTVVFVGSHQYRYRLLSFVCWTISLHSFGLDDWADKRFALLDINIFIIIFTPGYSL